MSLDADTPKPLKPNLNEDVTADFRTQLETDLWVSEKDLGLLRAVGCLYSAREPMMDVCLNRYWLVTVLFEAAYADENDELVTHMKLSSGLWLRWYTNGGSGIPFGMVGVSII